MMISESPLKKLPASSGEDDDVSPVPDHNFGGVTSPTRARGPSSKQQRPQGASSKQQQQQVPLSFANPGDSGRLYEQLSAKMVPIDPRTMLTVSSDEGSKGSVSQRRGGGKGRTSQSADPARCEAHKRSAAFSFYLATPCTTSS